MVDSKISEDPVSPTVIGLTVAGIQKLDGGGAYDPGGTLQNVQVPISVLQAEFGTASVPTREIHTADGTATLVLDEEPAADSALLLFDSGTFRNSGYSRVGKTITFTSPFPADGNTLAAWFMKAVPTQMGVTGKSITHLPDGVGPYAFPAGFVPVSTEAFRVFIGGVHQARDVDGDIAYTWDETGVTLAAPGVSAADDHVTIEVMAPLGIGVPGDEVIEARHLKSRLRALQLFERIIGTKGIAMATTALNTFATGFKGATDALNGVTTSTNSDVDAVAGCMSPTFDAETYSTLNNPSFTIDNTGGGSLNVRQQISTAGYLISDDGDRIIITASPAAATGMTISNMFVGHKGASAPDFDGGQVRVTFSGSNSVVLPANTPVASDAIDFDFDHTKDLIVAFDTANFMERYTASVTGQNQWTKAGTGEAGLTTTSGYSGGSGKASVIDLVQVRTAIGPASDQTIVFDTQTVDSTGCIFGMVPVQAVDALGTLGDNLVVEYQIGGGAWEECDLTSLGTMKLGSTSLTGLMFTKDGLTPGTSIAVRIRTLNNTDLRPYGMAYDTQEIA